MKTFIKMNLNNNIKVICLIIIIYLLFNTDIVLCVEPQYPDHSDLNYNQEQYLLEKKKRIFFKHLAFQLDMSVEEIKEIFYLDSNREFRNNFNIYLRNIKSKDLIIELAELYYDKTFCQNRYK